MEWIQIRWNLHCLISFEDASHLRLPPLCFPHARHLPQLHGRLIPDYPILSFITGMAISFLGKYSSNLKAAYLSLETDPSNPTSKYNHPVVLQRTTIEPKYLGFAFRFNSFSTWVFHIRTRLPSWKLWSWIQFLNYASNCLMDANHDRRTLSWISSISSTCFCSCWAH